MASGLNWSSIKRAITIVITRDVFMPEGDKYHHQFRYRTEGGIEFTDLSEINTLDLNKLPADDDSTELWYWMKFIKTDDEEVLDMLATRSPQMRKAVGVLKELSADEATRMLYEKREMARRDIESQLVEQYAIIAEKDAALAEKDAALADKDVALAEKDAALADKDAENELLRKQVAKLQAKLGGGN